MKCRSSTRQRGEPCAPRGEEHVSRGTSSRGEGAPERTGQPSSPRRRKPPDWPPRAAKSLFHVEPCRGAAPSYVWRGRTPRIVELTLAHIFSWTRGPKSPESRSPGAPNTSPAAPSAGMPAARRKEHVSRGTSPARVGVLSRPVQPAPPRRGGSDGRREGHTTRCFVTVP